MKKAMFILISCLLMQMTYAQQTPGTNTTEQAAQRRQNKQSKRFQNKKRYSSVVKNHQSKALARRQAKAGKGGGL
jgi:hypothetical protein